jgi:SAM-dependent methyltransferase
MGREWFSEWFDSPYYQILYHNRDEEEARFFLSNLIHFFKAPTDKRIIDLACGKGRHAIYLNSLGYDVTGVDLSAKSISETGKHANEKLHFEVQDLRTLSFPQQFDIALNLFTSFGYFASRQEDEKVLCNIRNILNPGGYLLIDFFNSELVLRDMVEHESREAGGIRFRIHRRVENDFIVKQITFADAGTTYEFTERVQALTLEEFRNMLKKTGFRELHVFGNYKLEPFNRNKSERLILVAQRND